MGLLKFKTTKFPARPFTRSPLAQQANANSALFFFRGSQAPPENVRTFMAAGRPPALGSGFHAGLSQIGNSPKDLPFRTTKLKQYGFDPHKPHSDNPVFQTWPLSDCRAWRFGVLTEYRSGPHHFL